MGSGLEARIALAELVRQGWPGEIYHLPTDVVDDERFQFALHSELTGPAAPAAIRLADVWGKTLFTLGLDPGFKTIDCRALLELSAVKRLPSGLELTRVKAGESGYLVTLSDSTELSCAGVLFGDGEESQVKLFWDKPIAAPTTGVETRRWSLLVDNVIALKTWDFRWASGKSVELVPLAGEKLLVHLRFKSRYGGELGAAELRELYSEFGSDMTAVLENLSLERVVSRHESSASVASFYPAPGCFALGRAAWAPGIFLAFSWLDRFVTRQIDLIAVQAQNPRLSGESFEAQSQELFKELARYARFASEQLHLDNPFLRRLRKALLILLPSSFLAKKVRARLNP